MCDQVAYVLLGLEARRNSEGKLLAGGASSCRSRRISWSGIGVVKVQAVLAFVHVEDVVRGLAAPPGHLDRINHLREDHLARFVG